MKAYTVFENSTGAILSSAILENDSDMDLQPAPPPGFTRIEGIRGDWRTQKVVLVEGVPTLVDK